MSWVHYLLLMNLLLTCWTWVSWFLLKQGCERHHSKLLFVHMCCFASHLHQKRCFVPDWTFWLRIFGHSIQENRILNKLPWWLLYTLIFGVYQKIWLYTIIFKDNGHKETTLKFLHCFKESLCAASYQTMKVNVS